MIVPQRIIVVTLVVPFGLYFDVGAEFRQVKLALKYKRFAPRSQVANQFAEERTTSRLWKSSRAVAKQDRSAFNNHICFYFPVTAYLYPNKAYPYRPPPLRPVSIQACNNTNPQPCISCARHLLPCRALSRDSPDYTALPRLPTLDSKEPILQICMPTHVDRRRRQSILAHCCGDQHLDFNVVEVPSWNLYWLFFWQASSTKSADQIQNLQVGNGASK